MACSVYARELEESLITSVQWMSVCKISQHIVALRKEKKICLVNLALGKYVFASSASWLRQKQLQRYPQLAKAFLTFREVHNNGSFLVGLGNARSNLTIKRTWSFCDDVEKDEKNVKEAEKGK